MSKAEPTLEEINSPTREIDYLEESNNVIDINKYFKRIMKYSKPEPSTLIISLIYIDKLCENTNFVLNSHNIHRIILASLMLAIKYNEDDYQNEYYAKVGGIALKEFNRLEQSILLLLDFKIYIDDATYGNYEKQLQGQTGTIKIILYKCFYSV